jgi:glutaminyl-peptide cyclotransferase
MLCLLHGSRRLGRSCSAALLLALACAFCRDRRSATRVDSRPAVHNPAPTGVATYRVEIVHAYPHDPTAFTEGLEWHDGTLYEGTGLVGRSGVRRTELATGAVRSHVELPPPHFGEGITVFHGTLYELTWKEGIGFRYDARSLAGRGRFTYAGEGWGLTHDDRSLIVSDGTNVLRFLDPATLRVERGLPVTADGMPVLRLNELERIHGEIWANVWQVPEIARIDPATGQVIGWIDLAPLVPQAQPGTTGDTVDVANGIAYDSAGDRIFVTGKLWPTLYQIRLGPRE